MNTTSLPTRVLAGVALATAFVLMINLAAMQFTDSVEWSWFDFTAAAVLLLGVGVAFAFATKGLRKIEHKTVAALVVLAALALLWVELAVGLVGSPIAGS